MLGPIAFYANEWIWVGLIAVVLLFGGAKMAQLGKGMGEGIREFKKSLSGESDTTTAPATTAPKAEEK